MISEGTNLKSLNNKLQSEFYNFHCYTAFLRKSLTTSGPEYHVAYDNRFLNELKNFTSYENSLRNSITEYILKKKNYASFSELLEILRNCSNDGEEISKQILVPVLFRTLNMERIAPLLLDEKIDEIYLDSGDSCIYIDHSEYGRCNTSIKLSKQEIDAFIHRVALENDFSLNRENPTMKGDFVSKLFHTRVTVDIPPLLIDDIHLDIRKFHPQNLRISDLIRLGTLTGRQAEFLKLLIQNFVSFSIIGPPNSGKTTLQNALLEYIPSHFRVLSVEDVLETSTLRKGNRVRFRLGYAPKDTSIYTKAMEIQKILHRSPDFVNLGELSTKDHFTAFLNVLSVGIPSIQTIHGKNAEYLLLRLQDIYQIPIGLIKTSFPHIFIELKTTWSKQFRKRDIFRICELTREGNLQEIEEIQMQPDSNFRGAKNECDTVKYIKNHLKSHLGKNGNLDTN